MKRKHKFIFASVILGIAVCLLGAFYYHTRTITLTLGMFSGSNWDVPSADSYRIIDETIQEFEKNTKMLTLSMSVDCRKKSMQSG